MLLDSVVCDSGPMVSSSASLPSLEDKSLLIDNLLRLDSNAGGSATRFPLVRLLVMLPVPASAQSFSFGASLLISAAALAFHFDFLLAAVEVDMFSNW